MKKQTCYNPDPFELNTLRDIIKNREKSEEAKDWEREKKWTDKGIEYCCRLAEFYMRGEKYEIAIKYFEEAVKLNPSLLKERIRVRDDCARCFMMVGRYAEAISIYSKHAEETPDLYLDIARWYVAAGKSRQAKKAIAMYEKKVPQAESSPSQNRVYTFQKGRKYGIFDRNGRVVVKPQLKNVMKFSDEDIRFKIYDRYCLIDIHGNISQILGDFAHGRARVMKGLKRWGFVDKTGDMVISPEYQWASDFHEGVACVRYRDKYGYINTSGNMVIRPEYQWASGFHEGVAHVRCKNKYGYINKNGDMVISPQFDRAHPFSEGLAGVRKDGREYFIDHKGLIKCGPFKRVVEAFYGGLARVLIDSSRNKGPADDPNDYAFIDHNGEIQFTLPAHCDYVGHFSEGMAQYSINGKYGYVNTKGDKIFEPQFDEAGPFHEGLAIVRDHKSWKSRKSMVIDKTGKFVFTYRYALGYYYQEGLTYILDKNSNFGFIDTQFKIVIKPQFDRALSFKDGMAQVGKGEKGFCGGQWGFIDKQGAVVVEPQFDNVCNFSEGLARVEKGGQWGCINKKGEMVFTVPGVNICD